MSSTCPEPQNPAGRTRIIAHRGASGYLPEHTTAAKAMAYGMGADFIEQDVVATRDGELVVLHDTYLDDVSDVAIRFPDRRRDDGHYYVIDFSFDELSEVTLNERRDSNSDSLRFAGRFPYDLPAFKVSRFEDEIQLVAGLNASTGRHVGIYPEIKEPQWHDRHGVDLTRLFHESLERLRREISGPVFVQSFDANALLRSKEELGTSFPLVQLLNRQDADNLIDDDTALGRIADYADGVGLPFESLMEPALVDGNIQATALPARLEQAGLLIHPYTMRRDVAPPGQIGYFEALGFLIHELEVDALFCDHPDDGLAVRDRSAA